MKCYYNKKSKIKIKKDKEVNKIAKILERVKEKDKLKALTRMKRMIQNKRKHNLHQITINREKDNGDEQKSKQIQDEENNGEKDGDKEEIMGDDHSLWEEAFKNKDKADETKEERKEDEHQDKEQKQNEEKSHELDKEFQDRLDEREEFEENRKEKINRFKNQSMKEVREHWGMKAGNDERTKLENIGEATHNVDWRRLLREAIENNQIVWGQRRSIAENNYAYRLEDREPEIKTEVMIDVSGSVDEELVKAFLRETKSILTQLQTGSDLNLKVGFFDTRFYDFVEIKTIKDVDNLEIPGRGGTDLDLPVRNFSKDKDINKIIFTDGDGFMPKEDLKNENVIWIVYGNRYFNPCCGRVININKKQINNMKQQYER